MLRVSDLGIRRAGDLTSLSYLQNIDFFVYSRSLCVICSLCYLYRSGRDIKTITVAFSVAEEITCRLNDSPLSQILCSFNGKQTGRDALRRKGKKNNFVTLDLA